MILEDMKAGLGTWPARLSGFLRLVYGVDRAAEPSDRGRPDDAVAAESEGEREVKPVWAGPAG
jgi:hypothetical protein